ncbi:MAG: hypothetical protein IJ438_09925 [Clostridia bacterium]|nr:hypothetical protein [Clostridia bacterium]
MSELYNNQQPRELNWDDPIANEDIELPFLPDGDYPFQVVSFEKARHNPREGGKLPPCNKAILTVRVTDRMSGRTADIRHSLFLHTSMEWRLCEFFSAIGQRQKGETLKMDWSRIVGSSGLCKIKKQERRDGRAASEIDRFYPTYDLPAGAVPAAVPAAYQQPAPASAPAYTPPAYSQPQQSYAAPQQPAGGTYNRF